MKGPDFLDTSILAFCYDDHSFNKQIIARRLLQEAILGSAVTSTHALTEFSTVLLHDRSRTPEDVAGILRTLEPVKAIAPDMEMILRAVEVQSRFSLHLRQAMILAAAERAGCRHILSEDFPAGEEYYRIRIENPFAAL
jgi:predicted nucleic acid-binding protein